MTAADLPTTGAGDPGHGFAAAGLDAQGCFRAVLDALARPGTTVSLARPGLVAPPGLPLAAAAVLLTLADRDTPVWLPGGRAHAAARWLAFHTGAAAIATAADAVLAVLDGAAPAPRLADFPAGDERYPDRSATLIVTCADLVGGEPIVLTGPGIRERAVIAPRGLRPGFRAEVRANAARFPLGVDMLLVAGDRLIGLPRSAAIAEDR
jgi:alpha-D-ribose 1-methylphosphonate 5-triphosphate synthase subunit PhnH